MLPGTVVEGRFAIERLAGTGGMGSVYRALDRRTGDAVALKVMRGKNATVAERFAREARILADLRHPGIVRYVGHGLAATGESWLAMEWLEGEDLGQRLGRAPLTPAEGLEVARLAAEALGAAHRAGVVHRDIKPENLFLPGGDLARLVLLDFGIARLGEGRGPTQTGMTIGTPAYMAPEQVRGSKSLDARADVYALGSVLFECLTGRAPFVGKNPMALLTQVLLEEAPRLGQVLAGAPAALERLLARMLAKDPARRPEDGAAAAIELAAVAPLVGGAASFVGGGAELAAGRAAIAAVDAPIAAVDAPIAPRRGLGPRGTITVGAPRTVTRFEVGGRATPFVGRIMELRRLEGLYDACAGDGGAQAAIVTGPPGAGKSRLLAELARRLEARGAPAQIWIGRGDPERPGVSLEVLGDAIRGAALPLGPAWEEPLATACARAPVILALEDLQWGDAASLALVDEALHRLHDRRLLAIASGRAEVHDLFPDLWAGRDATVIRLAGLSRKAATELARAVLGEGATAEQVDPLVERAAGNPAHLEELLRPERLEALARELAAASGGETEASIVAWIAASASVAEQLFLAGRAAVARALLDRVESCADTVGLDPEVTALLASARAAGGDTD